MSLVSFALRLVASRLVRGQTWAGSRIFNSPIDPIAEWQGGATPGQSEPCIAIYTGSRKANVTGKATQGRSAEIDLTFVLLLPPTVIVAAPAGGGEPEILLETSNTGGAMVMDMMARQIEASFRFGAPEWKEIWDIFVISISGIQSRPLLYEIEKGVQVPCVEVTYSLVTCPDPDFAVPLTPGWAKLKAAMLGDPDYAASAPLIDLFISSPTGLPGWREAQAALGLSNAATRALGIGPVDPTAEDDGAQLQSGVFTEVPADE